MSAIGQLEASIVARITSVLTAPDKEHPKIEVRAWPEKAREYKMNHPRGCAMVIYKGSKFSQDHDTAGQFVHFEAEFELGLISRTLREPNLPARAPESEASGTGIYDLLECCRAALLGWQPDQAAGVVRLRAEEFDDYIEGTWGYSLRFAIPMMTVADRPCPPGQWLAGGPNSCCIDAPPISSTTFMQPNQPD